MGCQQKWQGEYVQFAFITNETEALHQLKTYSEICYFSSGMFLLLLLSYHNHPLRTSKLRLHSFSTWKGRCWHKKI